MTLSSPPPSASALRIVWQPARSAAILEARMVDPAPGSPLDDVYVGYLARDAGDTWRGYLGVSFVPVGVGPRETLQEMIEQRAWELLRAGALTRGGGTGGA